MSRAFSILLISRFCCFAFVTAMCAHLQAAIIAQYLPGGGTPVSPTTQGWSTFEILEESLPGVPIATSPTTDALANAGPGTFGWRIHDLLDGNSSLDRPEYFHAISASEFSSMAANGWIATFQFAMNTYASTQEVRLLNMLQGAGGDGNAFSMKVNVRQISSDLNSNLRLRIQDGSGGTLSLDTTAVASDVNTFVFYDADGDGTFNIRVNGVLYDGGTLYGSGLNEANQVAQENSIVVGANASSSEGGNIEFGLIRLETIPEPSSIALMLLGTCGIFVIRRRR